MHEVEYWILYIVYLVFIIDWEKFKLYLGNLNFKPSIYKVSMYVCVFWRSLEKKNRYISQIHFKWQLMFLVCYFCRFDKIINKEIPSTVVFEDDKVPLNYYLKSLISFNKSCLDVVMRWILGTKVISVIVISINLCFNFTIMAGPCF